MSKVLITFFFFATAIGIGLLYAKPEWDNFQVIRVKTAELNAINTEVDEISQNGDELIRRINSISLERRVQLGLVLPQGPHAADFLVNLENISKARKMPLTQISLTSPKEENLGAQKGVKSALSSAQAQQSATQQTGQEAQQETRKSLPFTFSFGGEYEAMKAFLDDLEFNVRLMDPNHLRLQVSTQKNQQVFTVSYSGDTYYK